MPVKRKDNTEKIRAGIARGAGVGLREAAETVADLARTLVPVDTGELRDSIIVRGVNGSRTDVVAGAPHAVHVEFGTTKTPAQPYLLPSAEQVRTRLAAIVGAAIKDELQ